MFFDEFAESNELWHEITVADCINHGLYIIFSNRFTDALPFFDGVTIRVRLSCPDHA